MNKRNLSTPIRFAWAVPALVLSLACACAGQTSEIQNLVTTGNLEGMRWPDFSDYRSWLQKFYAPAGYAPAWVQGASPVPQHWRWWNVSRMPGRRGSTRKITTLRDGKREFASFKPHPAARQWHVST